MDLALDKSNFSIVVTSDGIEDFSEYWQEQCNQLYNSIARLSEGSIKPLEKEGAQGDKAVLVTLYSTLMAFEITREVFIDIIIPSIKAWLEFRPTAEVEFKCPDGTTVKITKVPISKLSKFFEENLKASVCEGLHSFKINE